MNSRFKDVRPAHAGKVSFVGAGPGSADLLTLRALRALRCADVVLHDDLVSRDVLRFARRSAIVVSVGKRCGHAGITQQAINSLLVDYARKGLRVVRLKCGDPSIFGRLAEEIGALRSAEVAYEIVPGVTAALAAAAAAGISLTQRFVASQVLFTTATLAGGVANEHWRALAAPGTTLVVYMPGKHFSGIFNELTQAGVASDLPCAIIAAAGSEAESVHTMTIADLSAVSEVPAPGVLVLGEVVTGATDARSRHAHGHSAELQALEPVSSDRIDRMRVTA